MSLRRSLGAIALIVAPVTAGAQVVFTNPLNGAAPDAGAFSQVNQILAGQFALGSGASVNAARWFGTMFSRDYFDGGESWSFDVQFRSNSGGQPGAVIATRSVMATVADIGLFIGGDEVYGFSTSFADVALGSGSYFFSAVNTGVQNTFRWTEGSIESYSGWYSLTGGASWNALENYRTPLNFELSANGGGDPGVVPEPSTYVLMASGLVMVAGLVRRRKLSA